MARVTLMDVARHCGVSRATVSLVLNDSPLVADEDPRPGPPGDDRTGYVYNRAAASLRTQHSDAIGVVLTNITNPYFAEFAAGLQDILTSSGTVPLLAVSGEDRELQHRLVRSLVERNVDGIVLVPAHGTTPSDLPDLLGTPLVLMARPLERPGRRLRGRAKPRRRVCGRRASVQPRLPANRVRRRLHRLLGPRGARRRRSSIPERPRSVTRLATTRWYVSRRGHRHGRQHCSCSPEMPKSTASSASATLSPSAYSTRSPIWAAPSDPTSE